jgi:hypothetical protein
VKILLINDYGTPTGGAEVSILSLRNQLRQRGHDARLFTTNAQIGIHKNFADYQCFGTISSFRTLLQTANRWAVKLLRSLII